MLNKQPVIDALNKFNGRIKANSCFDFYTLNAKIPHDELVKVRNEFIDFS